MALIITGSYFDDLLLPVEHLGDEAQELALGVTEDELDSSLTV